MSVVSYLVDTAQGFLEDSAETQFGAVAATVGTITTVAVSLVVILVCINMVFQYRAMDGRTAFWLGVKIILIGIFAQNWTQFNALSSTILDGIDSIAGSLIAAVGGGTPGPSVNRPLFAGDPEVRILGYGKDEERNTLSRGTARPSGADGFGSRGRICEQIGSNLVDFSEGWMQQGQPAHLGQTT
nr:type IV secretion system protein [Roseovarius sp. W115]MDV2927871.1 type IV secretion system protein [Roseovarius sp. W115]